MEVGTVTPAGEGQGMHNVVWEQWCAILFPRGIVNISDVLENASHRNIDYGIQLSEGGSIQSHRSLTLTKFRLRKAKGRSCPSLSSCVLPNTVISLWLPKAPVSEHVFFSCFPTISQRYQDISNTWEKKKKKLTSWSFSKISTPPSPSFC